MTLNLNGFDISEYLNVIPNWITCYATHCVMLFVIWNNVCLCLCVWWHNSVNNLCRDELKRKEICIGCTIQQISNHHRWVTNEKKNETNYYELAVRNFVIEILWQLLLMHYLPENEINVNILLFDFASSIPKTESNLFRNVNIPKTRKCHFRDLIWGIQCRKSQIVSKMDKVYLSVKLSTY